jgi:probable rRNA maturation factor
VPVPFSRLRVSVVDGHGRPARVPGLARWLARTAPVSARGEVSIALVSDVRIRALNRTYRKKDSATDVLSFPVGSALVPRSRKVAPEPWPRDPEPYLGDIVIARGVAARQAREMGHSVAVELRVLALHGLLHLLGYDHERDRGEMRRLERRLRRKGGLRDSLIERAAFLAAHRH